ncbi:hypothetical protein A9Q87_03470 [Flavobacteriales bacterium 34_180_T64]|nr:hypothetical protein A9Q87_03470 [Flavobacteriales bacterium 34_180_T64]
MKFRLTLVFFVVLQCVFGQQTVDTTSIDSNYREDQFYVSIAYNLLNKIPDGLTQSGFSSGLHLGFIRDLPINKKRNVALGIGMGLSSNSFNQNMLIQKENSEFIYSIIDESETSFTKNKFTMYILEMPIEFRWRTSTASDYKFWRLYPGFKFGYVFANSSKYSGSPSDIKVSKNPDFNSLQYGLTLSAGYDTWNVHFYYALNPIFNKDVKIGNESLEVSVIKIGLIFYIL